MRPARALADEAGEGRRLQAVNQWAVDIDAVPAETVQIERGFTVFRDADAAETVGDFERLAIENGRGAADTDLFTLMRKNHEHRQAA